MGEMEGSPASHITQQKAIRTVCQISLILAKPGTLLLVVLFPLHYDGRALETDCDCDRTVGFGANRNFCERQQGVTYTTNNFNEVVQFLSSKNHRGTFDLLVTTGQERSRSRGGFVINNQTPFLGLSKWVLASKSKLFRIKDKSQFTALISATDLPDG
ncbi:Uncharacterized protein TCM_015741 [Theobroma cacao]|uniref:Uncharacterized protein n=1 Tax=Theobroma cacao TaxID=3641 RepID=A0A061G388_THECC|nr:Uncharacterized protein TCM_015741 [Theobroma cacao]